mgnify:CR=1 FL=1
MRLAPLPLVKPGKLLVHNGVDLGELFLAANARGAQGVGIVVREKFPAGRFHVPWHGQVHGHLGRVGNGM